MTHRSDIALLSLTVYPVETRRQFRWTTIDETDGVEEREEASSSRKRRRGLVASSIGDADSSTTGKSRPRGRVARVSGRSSPSCLSRLCFLCFFEPMSRAFGRSSVRETSYRRELPRRPARVPRSVPYTDNTAAAIDDVTSTFRVPFRAPSSTVPPSWRRVARAIRIAGGSTFPRAGPSPTRIHGREKGHPCRGR